MAFIIGSPLLLVNLHFLDRRFSFGFKSQCLCVQVSSQVQIPSSNYLPFSCFLYSTDCKVTDFSTLNANKSFLFKLILWLLIKFGKSGEWKIMINTIFSLCLRRQREFCGVVLRWNPIQNVFICWEAIRKGISACLLIYLSKTTTFAIQPCQWTPKIASYLSQWDQRRSIQLADLANL